MSDLITLPKLKSKLNREDFLQQKRIAERNRINIIKNDPIKLAEYKVKGHLKYIKQKKSGKRKSIKDMTPGEKRKTRQRWREYNNRRNKNKET